MNYIITIINNMITPDNIRIMGDILFFYAIILVLFILFILQIFLMIIFNLLFDLVTGDWKSFYKNLSYIKLHVKRGTANNQPIWWNTLKASRTHVFIQVIGFISFIYIRYLYLNYDVLIYIVEAHYYLLYFVFAICFIFSLYFFRASLVIFYSTYKYIASYRWIVRNSPLDPVGSIIRLASRLRLSLTGVKRQIIRTGTLLGCINEIRRAGSLPSLTSVIQGYTGNMWWVPVLTVEQREQLSRDIRRRAVKQILQETASNGNKIPTSVPGSVLDELSQSPNKAPFSSTAVFKALSEKL